jgi:hypothetical protein
MNQGFRMALLVGFAAYALAIACALSMRARARP